jgi:hypothetical protein
MRRKLSKNPIAKLTPGTIGPWIKARRFSKMLGTKPYLERSGDGCISVCPSKLLFSDSRALFTNYLQFAAIILYLYLFQVTRAIHNTAPLHLPLQISFEQVEAAAMAANSNMHNLTTLIKRYAFTLLEPPNFGLFISSVSFEYQKIWKRSIAERCQPNKLLPQA